MWIIIFYSELATKSKIKSPTPAVGETAGASGATLETTKEIKRSRLKVLLFARPILMRSV
jgi:hypothetical protein